MIFSLRVSVSVAYFLILTGCATPVSYDFAPTSVEKVSTREYKLGELVTTPVGERMIRVADYQIKRTPSRFAKINTNTMLQWGNFVTELSPQKQYRILGSVPFEADTFVVIEYKNAADGHFLKPLAALARLNGSIHNRAGVVTQGQEFSGSSIVELKVTPPDSKFLFEASEKILEENGHENFEVIYSGINNSGMNFTYREFGSATRTNASFFRI
jgi:hypothetical protein